MVRYGFRNVEWNLDGEVFDWERAQLGVMMDIRAELRQLNALLACPNFTGIPKVLKEIRRNTKPTSDRGEKHGG